MNWRSVVVLAVSGVVGVACAQGSDTAAADDPASSVDPARPAAPDSGVADSSASATPAIDAATDVTVMPPPPPDAAAGTFVNGTTSGVSIAPAHAGAVLVATGPRVDRVVIAIQTRSGFCADYANGIDRASARTLILAVIAAGVTSSVTPGTYAIGTGKPASAGGSFDSSGRILSYDAQCTSTVAPAMENAVSGSITLSQVAASGVVGTFSLSFPGGGQLSGALDANVCTAPGADSFTCMP